MKILTLERVIPLARPTLGEAEEQAVIEVLRSRRLSLGRRVPEFEERFAERLRAPLASAVSSGTAGLHLSLRALGIRPGEEVVTSPFSFVASANIALYEGARPVFADIDPVTLNLVPQAAEAAITERTRIALPVHIFGYPADILAFESIAQRHRVRVLEDACEALGATYDDGIPVGARGIQTKPYLPAIHLMSFYRERFGHRPGEFPVCEEVAQRSLALPLFPEMTEGDVARAARELRQLLEGDQRSGAT